MNPIKIDELSNEDLKTLLDKAIEFVCGSTEGNCAGIDNKGHLFPAINQFIKDNKEPSLIALLAKAKRDAFNIADISRGGTDSLEKKADKKGLKLEKNPANKQPIIDKRFNNKHVKVAFIAVIKATFNLIYCTNPAGEIKCDLAPQADKDTSALAGIWKGYIVRSEDSKISEVAILLCNNGKCYYLSKKMVNGASIGQFRRYSETILHGSFVKESAYNFYYFLRITEDERLLIGTLAGFGETTGFKPAGGIIFFNKEMSWKGDEHAMLDAFNHKAIELSSYSLLKQEDIRALLIKKPYILNYFFGETEYVKNNLLIETVAMWQKAYLVPKFELDAKELVGDYIIYRLGTSRKTLVKRVIRIHKTGHLEMKLNRTDYDEEIYYGRVHFFDGHICIAIDRRRGSNQLEAINRTMYLFNAQYTYQRKNVVRFLGLSVIVNGERMIRAGEDVMIKAEDNTYDSSVAAIIKDNDIEGDERAIFDYLRKSEVITIDEKSHFNTPKNLTREHDLGSTYFESACFAAMNGKSVKCVEQLIKAIEYGFADKTAFNLQLNTNLSRWRDAIELRIDTKNLTLKP
jgi:hypothetical protein